ncbi:hypothetical protein RISK_003507 [Rhodopirellula islandica]|uniref:Uncharacterized protein n=1 Tax=Rhodopirellula islandica TaxID=595434 RepID=A0A0J1BCZ2_RHOIS|nr:hypothetical protein RISK_003507 [Rhodopirellula islandica]
MTLVRNPKASVTPRLVVRVRMIEQPRGASIESTQHLVVDEATSPSRGEGLVASSTTVQMLDEGRFEKRR